MSSSLIKVGDSRPHTFFSSNGVALTNLSQNDIVIRSDPIPQGMRGFLRDVNTIFTTSGGTIAYEKVTSSGTAVRFAAAITANSNGSFDLVLGAGDMVQIALTSTGVGVLDITWDGEIQRVLPEDTENVFVSSGSILDDGI